MVKSVPLSELAKALISSGEAKTPFEAIKTICDMRKMVLDGGFNALEVLEMYGLEPDYIEDLILS